MTADSEFEFYIAINFHDASGVIRRGAKFRAIDIDVVTLWEIGKWLSDSMGNRIVITHIKE